MTSARQFKIDALLQSINSSFTLEKESTAFFYHGIKLNFLSTDVDFLLAIKNYLPQNWENKTNEGQKIIFLAPPPQALSFWEDSPSADCEQWQNEHGHMALQRDFVALIDLESTIWVMTPLKIDDGFFNAMRWILSQRLISLNKTVLHSSAVTLDPVSNEAYVFMGKSGAGKTTIASLAQDRLVLGDDMNILEIKNKELYIEAARLGQRIQDPKTYGRQFKVKKILWPVQDTTNYLRPIPDQEIGLKIISSMANIYWPSQDKKVINDSLELAAQFKKLGTFFYLHFTRSKEFWHVLN